VEERELRARCDAGDFGGATTGAIERYGAEVYGFLVTMLRDPVEAGDAFSMFSEDLWRGIGRFEWRSSLRTWMYTLARHAALRLRAEPHRHAERRLALSQAGELAAAVRSATATFQTTAARDRFAELRDSLSMESQALLTLRVDRKLDWREIAGVLEGPEVELDEESLERAAARWRKRFQALKDELRDRARALADELD
jgi:RNA polymerase sigma-70 factor, ECF subfamily